ncbi:MAG: hypothetical protein KatS3mg095_0058 [Candidatus Parcubacteria bacterium]|nr:MAG: hypothetical protein KatS3mg095_0058 [Candidatus Parcubacteria bacterium]
MIVFFIFIFSFFIYQNSYAQLLISECMYNPKGNDNGREWIELINQSQNIIEVKGGKYGWKINDGDNHLFKQNLTVNPGEVFIITQNKDLFLKEYPNFSGKLIEANFYLKNNEGKIQIFDENKRLLSEINYNKYCGGDNNGYSIIFQNGLCKENEIAKGTPGKLIESNNSDINNQEISYQQLNILDNDNNLNKIKNDNQSENNSTNSSFYNLSNILLNQSDNSDDFNLISQSLLINEFLPNPLGKDKENEFIELFNESSKDINLNDFILEVNKKKIQLEGLIKANDYFVIYNKKYNFSIKNKGETLNLYFKNNKIFSISYQGNAPNGKSFSRDIDGSWKFSEPTPGNINIFLNKENKNYFNKKTTYLNQADYVTNNTGSIINSKNLSSNINKEIYSIYVFIIAFFVILSLGFIILLRTIF